MVSLRQDVGDVFRAGRYGLSGKKISIHFVGILITYLIYEALVYLSLLVAGQGAIGEFWSAYGLLPICPLGNFRGLDLPILTHAIMWVGALVAFVIFFLASTAVSKVAIEQLRGDDFYSMKEARGFTKKQWRSVFGAFIFLFLLFIFCVIWPIAVGLLGKIPAVGNVFVLLASLLLVPAFFLGLLMMYLLIVLLVALFFAPAITAVEGQDSFENIYQLFSLVWNQPWRLIIYEDLLLLTKALCVPILALVSLLGFSLILGPIHWLIPDTLAGMLGYTDAWLGGSLSGLKSLLPWLPFEVGLAADVSPLIWIAAIPMTGTWIAISFFVGAYLLSVASTGNVLIYVVLRFKTSGENLLEVPEEEAMDASDESTEAASVEPEVPNGSSAETTEDATQEADQPQNTISS